MIINNITNILNETLKKGLELVSLEKEWEKFSKGEKLEPTSKIQIVGKCTITRGNCGNHWQRSQVFQNPRIS